MSDLQCPATIIVARHAEAEFDTDLVSDDGGSLTPAGRSQARQLGESLLERNVAVIWCSDLSRAVQTAEIVAAVIGKPVRVRAGLREFAVGDLAGAKFWADVFEPVFTAWSRGALDAGTPGGESGADVVCRMRIELEMLADAARGETVLVVSHNKAMSLTLPLLARNVPDRFAEAKTFGNCATCELVVDADAWVLRSWGGQPIGNS